MYDACIDFPKDTLNDFRRVIAQETLLISFLKLVVFHVTNLCKLFLYHVKSVSSPVMLSFYLVTIISIFL